MAPKPKRSEPKAKGTSRASKPRKSSTKSPTKAGAKAKPGAEAKRAPGQAASRLIDERIQSLGGWRAETLAEVRRLIHEADPDIMEECKWIKPSNPLGVPVWSHVGIVCTGEAYTQVVKLTFARGASFEDPRGLFNSSLEGNMRRAIDIREGEVLDVQFDECTRTRVSGSMPPTYEVAIAATSRAELLPHGRGSIGPDHDATPRVWAGLALVAASSPMTRR